MVRTQNVKAGGWQTLEWFWNQRATVFIREPQGAEVKIRYGTGWLGWDSQKQTLDGIRYKTLSINRWTVTGARVQIRVGRALNVTYDVYLAKSGSQRRKLSFSAALVGVAFPVDSV